MTTSSLSQALAKAQDDSRQLQTVRYVCKQAVPEDMSMSMFGLTQYKVTHEASPEDKIVAKFVNGSQVSF